MRVCVVPGVVLCVVVFFMTSTSQTWSQSSNANSKETAKPAPIPTDIVVLEAHILVLKNALNLRPAQMPLWNPVETALYEMANWQAASSSSAHFDTAQGEGAKSESAKSKSDAAVLARLKRIASTAAPLIKALDEEQKSTMMSLARSAGLERLLLVHY